MGTDQTCVGSNTKFPESFPSGTRVAVTWISQPTASRSRCLLPTKIFPPFSQPLCTWSALRITVCPRGCICAYADAHPNPRRSSWRVMWVGRRAPDRDFGMSVGIGLQPVLTEMSSNQNLEASFRIAAPRWAVLRANAEEAISKDWQQLNRVVLNKWNCLPSTGFFFVWFGFFVTHYIACLSVIFPRLCSLKQMNFQTLFWICQAYLIISPIQSKPLENPPRLIPFQLHSIFSVKKNATEAYCA